MRLPLFAALLAATPAAAHPGPHMHPHGYEAVIVLGMSLAVAAAVIVRKLR